MAENDAGGQSGHFEIDLKRQLWTLRRVRAAKALFEQLPMRGSNDYGEALAIGGPVDCVRPLLLLCAEIAVEGIGPHERGCIGGRMLQIEGVNIVDSVAHSAVLVLAYEKLASVGTLGFYT